MTSRRFTPTACLAALGLWIVGCGDPPVIQGAFAIDPEVVEMAGLAPLAAQTEHVEILNQGEGRLDIQSIHAVDTGDGLFEVVVTDALPFTIEPGENFYFGVGFYGAPNGTYDASVEVTYDLKPEYMGGGRPAAGVDQGAGVHVYPLAIQAVVGVASVDQDGDGYGEADGDCDDFDANVHPGAEEQCNGNDDDCDGGLPDDEIDADADGWMVCDGDCDDASADSYPGAAEICDGLDNDCDGTVEDEHEDQDGDGYSSCDGDCDDLDATRWPDAPELCDGLDNDCDGMLPGLEQDADGDGVRICDGDCDDDNADTYPGAPELCDGMDNDCDGVDEDDQDLDGDGVTP